MKERVVLGNLDYTLTDLWDQTGLEAGVPTKRCHGVVVGGLTGARLDFGSYPYLTDPEKVALERAHGLTRSMVMVPGRVTQPMETHGLLQAICKSSQPSFDAILVHGTAFAGDLSEEHIVAIVTDGKQPIGVIDSLAPKAWILADAAGAAHYIDERFPPARQGGRPGTDGNGRSWHLILDAAGNTLRTPGEQWVRLGGRVLAYMPPLEHM